jgi:hypothetical protein
VGDFSVDIYTDSEFGIFDAKSVAKTALKFAPKAAQISKQAAPFRGVLCWLSASINRTRLPSRASPTPRLLDV